MTAVHPPCESMLAQSIPALKAIVARMRTATAIALDVEADGLFAYRPQLCTMQLAWQEADRVQVAVVDTLAVPADMLAPLLGACGPIKVLHDLTFDARLLAEAGAPLGNVRDTSV